MMRYTVVLVALAILTGCAASQEYSGPPTKPMIPHTERGQEPALLGNVQELPQEYRFEEEE